MSSSVKEIIIQDTELPLLSKSIFNQQYIEKDGNQIPISNLVLLPQVLASLDLPPNATTLKVVDTILLDDGSNTSTINPTSITYSSNATITAPNFLIDTGLGQTALGDVNISNNGLIIQVDDNGGQINLDSKGFKTTIGDVSNSANHTKIQVSDDYQYISQYGGKMSRNEEINNTIGSHLEANANFFTSNGDNVRLYDVSNYSNPLTTNNDGWYCYVCNTSGGDIDLTSDDNKYFCSHTNGFNTGPIQIKKYATARITLVWSQPFGDYFWSVLQY